MKNNQQMYEALTKGGIPVKVRVIRPRSLEQDLFSHVKDRRDSMRVELQERFKDYYPCVRALQALEATLQELCVASGGHSLIEVEDFEQCRRCDMKLYQESDHGC